MTAHDSTAIVIRHATAADARALTDLAILHDGSSAADPFAPTVELVELLRLHARRAHGVRSPRARRLAALWASAPTPAPARV